MISFAKLAASLQNENWLIHTALGYHKFYLFRRRDRILVRRPSYRKILTELGGHHNMLQGQLIFVLIKKRWHSQFPFQFNTSVWFSLSQRKLETKTKKFILILYKNLANVIYKPIAVNIYLAYIYKETA
jgi:hypothetical protein